MSRMAAHGVELSTPENIFEAAAADFRAALSEEQRRSFQFFNTPVEMIESLKKHIVEHSGGKRSRLLAGCALIDSGCRKIEPYFKIIDILVSSHPEWAGIAWGAIRLVFLLSRHFVSFFEKLAEMLKKILDYLPLYEKHMVVLKERASEIAKNTGEAAKWKDTLQCLSRSLAYVYVDILKFCDDARRLFPTRDQSLFHKARVVQDLFWTPFDDRFSKTLERLKHHRELFEHSLDYVYNEEILKLHSDMDKEIRANSNHRQKIENERESREKDALRMRANELRQWIAASDWAKAHDEADNRRLDESCNWFIEQDTYCSWARDATARNGQHAPSTEVLLVTGKPGYGKTVLCSRIIEDLRHRMAAKLSPSDSLKVRVVAYFYFTKLQSASDSGGAAFRAILAQIVQDCHLDPVFIDAASVLQDKGRGQNHASEKEVREIVHLFLRLLGPSYLVFDGLDECSDAEEFVPSILETIRGSDTKILIITRPSLHIPSLSGAHCPVHYIGLENEENLPCIELYLRTRISKLIKEEALPADIVLNDVVAQLVSRTNSIFLWAVLMSNYLSLPYLTANERLHAIHQLNRFEGLDSMYMRILEEIQRRTPEKQQAKMFLIFQWVAVARRPLAVEALSAGLAVQKDRRANVFDFIRDFEKALPQMCGSLVEVRKDRTVDFIHASVVDFLVQERSGPNEATQSFCITFAASEASMAELSFSYLAHEVSDGPLTSFATIDSERQLIEARLPLLSYVSQYWPSHAATAILSLPQSEACEMLCSAINRFIHQKRLVTVWIEALSIFNRRPDLNTLVLNASLLCAEQPRLTSRTIPMTFVDAVRRFAISIEHLFERWCTVLVSQPSEVWGPSIQAWSQCEFLVDSNHAGITALSSDNDLDWILIASETSSDGKELGTIKVLPPHHFRPLRRCAAAPFGYEWHNIDDLLDLGWKAMYTIWSLQTLKVVYENKFDLQETQISPGGFSKNLSNGVFKLPVAFSSTLRMIAVADLVFRARDDPLEADSPKTHSQLLPASGCQHTLIKPMLVQWSKGKTTQKAADSASAPHARHTIPGHTCLGQVYHSFSPGGLYLAALEGDNLGITSSWVLTIFEDLAPQSSKPSFARIASIGMALSPYILNGRRERITCFHPFEPVAAFCPLAKVVIWEFTVQGKGPVEAYSEPLADLGFSSCGQYLHGKKGSNLVVLALASFISPRQKPMQVSPTQYQPSDEPCNEATFSKLTIDQLYPAGNTTTNISPLQPFISLSEGSPQLRTLNQNHGAGSIVLEDRRKDGTLLHATLARTPDSKTLQTSVPTLITTPHDHTFRIVFNKAAQPSYSTRSVPDVALPLVFDRRKDTVIIDEQILAYRNHGAGKRTLEDGEENEGVRRSKLARHTAVGTSTSQLQVSDRRVDKMASRSSDGDE